ncbi:hypothetical protein SLE2022_149690 [Rubroshorea leprosula]
MSPAAVEEDLSSSLVSQAPVHEDRRFANLRGVQWRIHLGILPSSSSIDVLRRLTADSRRRYASLRRRLLVDPHVPKEGSNSPDLTMDNPLSQNPDSTWSRFFQNAELEKMVDQDLSRLYPEQGSYFQTPGCQGMLRRILLLWCLRHPEHGYRQGMHELLAPLLYVLHVDIECLYEVRKLYDDQFTDKFDGLSFEENDSTYNFDFKKFLDSVEDELGSQGNSKKVRSLNELEPEIQNIILLTDAYGAEGELGIVLSEKFMEHDAYCMFDALMIGAHGSVAMVHFFTSSLAGSHSGLPPVIEASAALYHLLYVVDSSLHSHLIELGVEPQYFALRWLRVLFGREFSLQDLLIIWDEIFAADNIKLVNGTEDDLGSSFILLTSPRGALISAMAVSMILYIRSSLLATENATSCLQRLLNFPENINLGKIIEKAKSLQIRALDANVNVSSSSFSFDGAYNHSKSVVVRSHNLPSDPVSPKTPLSMVSDSYWEEKWKVVHEAEEQRQGSSEKQKSSQRKRWSEKVQLRLSKAEFDPSLSRVENGKRDHKSTTRRSLLEDLSRQLGLDEQGEKFGSHEASSEKDQNSVEAQVEGQNGVNKEFTCTVEERCPSGNIVSEEDSSTFSDPTSPANGINARENDSEKSSVASNLFMDENDDHSYDNAEDSPLPVSIPPDGVSLSSPCNNDSPGKTEADLKDQNLQSGKFHFQWFWKFGQSSVGNESSEKGGGTHEVVEAVNGESNKSTKIDSSSANVSRSSSPSSKGDAVDQNVMGTLNNIGQSMLEQIQVLESVFQQDRGQGSLENFSKNVLVGKGQVTAVSALKELRKISNLLSEM